MGAASQKRAEQAAIIDQAFDIRARMSAYFERYPHHHPLEILVKMANDLTQPSMLREKAASDALPYLMPRMSTISLHKTTEPPSSATIEKLRDLMHRATSNPVIDASNRVIDVTPTREDETTEAEVVELPKRAP